MKTGLRARCVILAAILLWSYSGTTDTATAQPAENAQTEDCFAAPDYRCVADLAVAASAFSESPFEIAMTRSFAAATLAIAGDAEAAEASASSAIQLFDKISDQLERDIIMTNIVWYKALLGQTADATEVARNIPNIPEKTLALVALAEGQARQGDRGSARKTLAAVVEMLDRDEENIASNGILPAFVVYAAGLADDENTLLKARKLSRSAIGKFGDPYTDAIIYAMVAAGEAAWGDYEVAADTVVLAVVETAKLGRTTEAAECLGYVLVALAEIGEKDPVDNISRRIIGLVRKEKDIEYRAGALRNLAWALAIVRANDR